MYHISCATAQRENDVLYYQQYTIYKNILKKAHLFTAASCLYIGRLFCSNFLTTFRVSFKKLSSEEWDNWRIQDFKGGGA